MYVCLPYFLQINITNLLKLCSGRHAFRGAKTALVLFFSNVGQVRNVYIDQSYAGIGLQTFIYWHFLNWKENSKHKGKEKQNVVTRD